MTSDTDDLLAVCTTCGSHDEALGLAQAVVAARLAACVQIDAIDSVYRWDGALQQSVEWRLTCKSTGARWPALLRYLQALHPYELPAIWAVRLGPTSAAYAAWLQAECAEVDITPGTG